MIEIRRMRECDKPALLEMMIGFYASPAILHKAPIEILERDIDDCISDLPFVEGYVVERDGDILGYTMISKGYSTEYGGMSIMIEDLFVKESERGGGLGSKLLQYIEDKYRSTAVRLRLEAEPSNERAVSLYRKCGYEILPYTQLTKEL